MPSLPVTVEYDFYHAMAVGTSEAFADSYLSGAELHRGILLPRTHKAWERISDSWAARQVLREQKVVLKEPPFFDAMQNVQMARAA